MSTRKTARIFYVLTFFDNLTFTLPIWVLFGTEYLDLSYLQTIVVLSIPVFFFGALLQVPAGAWADRHGRKKAYILGSVLGILSSLPFFFTREFELLLLTLPVTAIGVALRAGSVEALVSVSSDEHGEVDFLSATSRGTSLWYLARVVGSPIGGVIYAIDPRWPLAASSMGIAVSILVALQLDEVRRPDTDSVHTYIRNTFRVFREAPAIWKVLGFVGLHLFITDMMWLAYQPKFIDEGLSIRSLGWIFTLISLLAALGAEIYRRKLRIVAVGHLLAGMALASGIAATGLATIHGTWIVLATTIVPLVGAGVIPMANAYIATRTPEDLRATALSFVTLFWGLGTTLSWIVGAILLDTFSTQAVFIASGCGAALMAVIALGSGLNERADEPAVSSPG